MKLGRAAIVSLEELTIDFLLSIINAVLTTKQGGCTHKGRPGVYLREHVALWEVQYVYRKEQKLNNNMLLQQTDN